MMDSKPGMKTTEVYVAGTIAAALAAGLTAAIQAGLDFGAAGIGIGLGITAFGYAMSRGLTKGAK